MSLSISNGYFVAVQSFESFVRFKRFFHSLDIRRNRSGSFDPLCVRKRVPKASGWL